MRRKRQPSAASMIQIGIAGILIILLVLLVLWYGDGLNSYKPEDVTFQYVAGVKVEYSDRAVYRNNKGNVSVREQDEERTIDNMPILHSGRRRMTIPVNMMIMMPEQTQSVWRVNYFTDITAQDGKVVLEKDGKSADVFGGFLYDGSDMYVFLEKADLHIGVKTIELEPLSYIRVLYKQYIEYYNSADGTYDWIATENIKISVDCEGGYRIDPGTDVIDMGSGEALIYSAVDTLQVLSMR